MGEAIFWVATIVMFSVLFHRYLTPKAKNIGKHKSKKLQRGRLHIYRRHSVKSMQGMDYKNY